MCVAKNARAVPDWMGRKLVIVVHLENTKNVRASWWWRQRARLEQNREPRLRNYFYDQPVVHQAFLQTDPEAATTQTPRTIDVKCHVA